MGDAPLSGRAWRNGGSRALRIGALLAVMPVALIAQGDGSDSPWHFDPPDGFQLTPGADNRQTDHYAVGDLLMYFWTDRWHDSYCYPNDNDLNPPNIFWINPNNLETGDFNADGHQDLVITWYTSPNPIVRPPSMVTFLLNDSQGNLVDSTNSLFSSGPPPERIFANRIQVADFNGDSADDLIIGTMGVVGRECLGEPPAPVKEPFLLILSDGNGGMVDASNQIEGQEDGGPPDNKDFAHDLAVGDIDGDGDQDFYSAKFLFLNDGRGNFQNASWMLPRALRSIGGVLASAMGDLDGDHVDDLVVLPFEGVGNKNHVFLSSGASSLAEYRHIELPEGLFGANTKSLDTIIRDFDQDGRNDIMVTQRVPVRVICFSVAHQQG